MRTTRLSGLLALALGLLAAAPAPGRAQSLLASRGLGLVVDPIDARMRALGGVALGLPGNGVSFHSATSAVGLPAPIALVGYQYDSFSADFDGLAAEGTTARFPLILAATPVGERWAFMAGYAGFIDQNWAVERADTVLAGPDTLAVLDRVASSGGVARLRFGGAYRVVEGLSVGLGLDLYTGSVQSSAGRRFPGEETPRCCTARWSFSGVGYNAGVSWQPSQALSLAAAGSLGGTLEAETQDSLAVDRSYDLPATLTVGASGRVAANTLLAASADWAGWSGLDEELARTGGARDAWSVRGGVEWDGLQIRDRPIPIRLGTRFSALPFRWEAAGADADWVDERAYTGGIGVVLAGTAARADLAVERGQRGGEAAGIDESYWRFALSLSVLGR